MIVMFNKDNNSGLPFVSEKQLIAMQPIPASTFYKFKSEWVSKGRSLTEMGMFHIEGSGMNYWSPQKYFEWLVNYKIKQPAVFNYEKEDQVKTKQTILALRRKGYRTNEKEI